MEDKTLGYIVKLVKEDTKKEMLEYVEQREEDLNKRGAELELSFQDYYNKYYTWRKDYDLEIEKKSKKLQVVEDNLKKIKDIYHEAQIFTFWLRNIFKELIQVDISIEEGKYVHLRHKNCKTRFWAYDDNRWNLDGGWDVNMFNKDISKKLNDAISFIRNNFTFEELNELLKGTPKIKTVKFLISELKK